MASETHADGDAEYSSETGELQGLKFVFSGSFVRAEREEAHDIVERHGGEVQSAVLDDTDYLIIGVNAEQQEHERACEHDVPVLDEWDFVDFLSYMFKK